VNHRKLRCSALHGLRCLRLNVRPALAKIFLKQQRKGFITACQRKVACAEIFWVKIGST